MKQYTSETLCNFYTGFKDGIPLMISIFSYGLVFGLLSHQIGLSSIETISMSAFVFAGSAQFTALSMLKTNASFEQIIFTTFLLNLRHLLMGISLSRYLQKINFFKLGILAFFLNDESYALTINHFTKHGGNALYFLGAGLATYLGLFLGSSLTGIVDIFSESPEKYGLNFAFIGVLIALLIPQLTTKAMWLSFLVSTFVVFISIELFSGNWFIILAGISSAIVGLGVELLED